MTHRGNHGRGGRGVGAARIEHDRHPVISEEGLHDLIHDLLARGNLAAADEDRSRREVPGRPGEDRPVNDIDDVLWCHIAVTEKDVGTGIHRHHAVKGARAGVRVELEQYFSLL